MIASPRTCSGAAYSGVSAPPALAVSVRGAPRVAASSLAMPKSSSFTVAVGGDEDVRRLEVAMDDEVRVRVADRGQT